MTMPKWHEIMRPVLVVLNDAEGYVSSAELYEAAAEEFHLTEEERDERVKSGEKRFHNRLGWAIVDLRKANLLEYGDRRGTYKITGDGVAFLSRHPKPFGPKELMGECPSFKEWKTGYLEKHGRTPPANQNEEEEMSPQETMAKADKDIRDALADELLQNVVGMNEYDFEFLVAKLLVAMGYGQSLEEPATVTPKSNDGGIDGIVKEDRLGFDNVYYQAKKWALDSVISKPEIQKFSGALNERHAQKGLFITTAGFSSGARKFAETVSGQRIVLVDGMTLAHLMIDYNVGVTVKETYTVKAIDKDFFES